MNRKRSDGLPPNFDVLSRDMQIACEEDLYRRQLKWRWGFHPGDPRLTSMNEEGISVSAQFGKKVKDMGGEHGDEHARFD